MWYGAAVLGLFALAQTVLFLITIFTRLGLDTASIRFVSEKIATNKNSEIKEIYLKILYLVIPLCLFMSVLMYFSAQVIAIKIFYKPDMTVLLKIVAIAITPFTILFIHSEIFRGFKNTILYSFFRQSTLPIIATVFLVIFYLNNSNQFYNPLISHLISIGSLFVISSIILWKKTFSTIPNLKIKSIKFQGLLKISIPMMFTSSMLYILQWTDTLVLGIYRPEWEIGVYNIAIKISMVSSITLFAINSIAAPKFAELFYSKKMQDFKIIIHQSTRLIFWTSIPILIIFITFPQFFLGIFGEEYIVGKWAMVFLVIGQFINAISGSVGYILQMTGKQKYFQKIILFSTLINLILNFILIPVYGIIGAAIASMISIAIWNIISIYKIYKSYGILTVFIPQYIRSTFI